MNRGQLFLVATPIGNLEDITLRALRILREADVIACEDTRHSRKLLDHYGIDRPLVSYHEFNESAKAADLIRRVLDGARIALISDAGTPLVSDPGFRLVEEAVRAGVEVTPVPGPSGILAALTASGLAVDAFYFGGFLPAKSGQRRRTLESMKGLDGSLVYYEAPHRLAESLEDIAAVMPERPMVVARELTKLHEEFWRGRPADLLERARGRDIQGEITLVLGRPDAPGEAGAAAEGLAEAVAAKVAGGLPRMDAIKAVARERGLGKREVYAALEAE